jgi:CRP-like cAMP-binding protein
MSVNHEALLARAPLFAAVGPEMARALVHKRTPRFYDRGEGVFRQDDPADAFFCVVEGWVKVSRATESGEEIVDSICSAGDTFGEAAMFSGGAYPASAETAAPSRILRIDGAALRRAIVNTPQIALDMLASFSIHLKALVERIERLKVKSPPQRIADLLLDQAGATSGAATVALPYEQLLIANRLGMKPESFSRALGKLRGVGVKVCRDNVLISDVGRLQDYAGRSGDETGAG